MSGKIAQETETVKGAFQTKQGGQIPLFRQMPPIIPATRGVNRCP